MQHTERERDSVCGGCVCMLCVCVCMCVCVCVCVCAFVCVWVWVCGREHRVFASAAVEC